MGVVNSVQIFKRKVLVPGRDLVLAAATADRERAIATPLLQVLLVLLEVLRVGVYLGHWVVVLAGVIARRAVAEHREEECVLGESGAAGMRERERERERKGGRDGESVTRPSPRTGCTAQPNRRISHGTDIRGWLVGRATGALLREYGRDAAEDGADGPCHRLRLRSYRIHEVLLPPSRPGASSAT